MPTSRCTAQLRDPREERRAGEDVVEPPADVALPHVAPRRPPREHLVVVGIERAADVDEAARDDPFELRALLGQLADRRGLRSLGCTSMSVRAMFRSPQMTSRLRVRGSVRGECVERVEEPHLGAESPCRRSARRPTRPSTPASRASDDPVLVVEGGVDERRAARRDSALLTCRPTPE